MVFSGVPFLKKVDRQRMPQAVRAGQRNRRVHSDGPPIGRLSITAEGCNTPIGARILRKTRRYGAVAEFASGASQRRPRLRW